MFKQFLITCSGADKSILDDPRCEVERTKYAAIGATVLSTAVLASLSGGYAIYTTFQSYPMSILLGIIWALIIFNLDRYIVSSLRKDRISPALNRQQRLAAHLRQYGRALPRFALAILIAIVITRPIELRLFAREIAAYVDDEKTKKLIAAQEQKEHEFPRIAELQTQNSNLSQSVSSKEAHCDELHELAMAEGAGQLTSRTSGKRGKGPLFNERWQNYHDCRTDLGLLQQQVNSAVAANLEQIKVEEAKREAGLNATRRTIEAMDGLLMRLKGHAYLTSQNGWLLLASLLIVMLFILLETAPLIIKLWSGRGPYDEIYDAIEHEVYVAERKRISDINDDTNTRVSLRNRRNATILDAELRLRKSLVASLESLADQELKRARREIATTLVASWREAELRNFQSQFQAVPPAENGKNNAATAKPNGQPGSEDSGAVSNETRPVSTESTAGFRTEREVHG